MNVLFVSQCSGNALTETRRILDLFAERRGERSWATPITWEGLKTVHKLLRQKARKNTSVACFWLHRDRSELLWIVGDARRFNDRGVTPTNTTTRDLLRARDEDNWRHGEVIRLLAALAALFHDFGKACAGFQAKLRGNARSRDAYRHEWVSLRLFAALVGDAKDDVEWLQRLADPEAGLGDWENAMIRDGLDSQPPPPLKPLPPLAQAAGWLILTHHRLPEAEFRRTKALQKIETAFRANWCGADPEANETAKQDCWRF